MLFKYNIKIIYRSRSQNFKVNALTRIIKCKFIDFINDRLRQQYQIIFISNRLNFDNIEFEVNIINDSLFYKMFEVNKIDNKCNKIREAIINNNNKIERYHI